MAEYTPRPIDTREVDIGSDLAELAEKLAENAHENWARLRLQQGWSYGPRRDDEAKKHPNLVPYEALTEADKDLDRGTALETIKAVLVFGYEIKKR
ncbi:MAG: RyR domain-containing protein [Filomicrobium sp.]